MEEYQTWRELLAALLAEPRTRARLTKEVGVDIQTLERWVAHTATPRLSERRLLLRAVPERQLLLRALLAEEFDDGEEDELADAEAGLVAFSAQILDMYASTTEEARSWSIRSAILAEALRQLDPQHHELGLSIVECLPPPRNQPVRALREGLSLGPGSEQIEMRTSFLGAESLAGSALATSSTQVIADKRLETRSTPVLPEYALSGVACPIMHGEHIAGCLLAFSVLPAFCARPAVIRTLQNYASLLTLAFEPEQFYAREQLALQIMPSLQVQQPYLAVLPQRILATLKTAFNGQQALSYMEAQIFVWTQVTEELGQLQTH